MAKVIDHVIVKCTLKFDTSLSFWQALKLRIAGTFRPTKNKIPIEKIINGIRINHENPQANNSSNQGRKEI